MAGVDVFLVYMDNSHVDWGKDRIVYFTESREHTGKVIPVAKPGWSMDDPIFVDMPEAWEPVLCGN